MTNIPMTDALRPLAAIADAFEADRLEVQGLRPASGTSTDFADESVFEGRGGRELLTLGQAVAARTALRSGQGVTEALAPLVAIANAFDANGLDDGARKIWGRNDEHINQTDPAEIELVTTDSGALLLSLADALTARELCQAA